MLGKIKWEDLDLASLQLFVGDGHAQKMINYQNGGHHQGDKNSSPVDVLV